MLMQMPADKNQEDANLHSKEGSSCVLLESKQCALIWMCLDCHASDLQPGKEIAASNIRVLCQID